MGLYLVLATSDLRMAVTATCTSSYVPWRRLAVVSYAGSAEELVRRLDLDRGGGPGALVGRISARRALMVTAGFVIAFLSWGMLI